MSQEISNPVTHAIIFTTNHINSSLHRNIITFSVNQAKRFCPPALGYITMSSIARIPEIEDFNEQFPDKNHST